MIGTLIWQWVWNWLFGWGGAAGVVAVVAWGLWAFTPAFLVSFRNLLFNVAVGATIFLVASTYFFSSGMRTGYATAINAIAAQDQEAVNAADAATSDFRRCRDSGGVWRPATGKCEGR